MDNLHPDKTMTEIGKRMWEQLSKESRGMREFDVLVRLTSENDVHILCGLIGKGLLEKFGPVALSIELTRDTLHAASTLGLIVGLWYARLRDDKSKAN